MLRKFSSSVHPERSEVEGRSARTVPREKLPILSSRPLSSFPRKRASSFIGSRLLDILFAEFWILSGDFLARHT